MLQQLFTNLVNNALKFSNDNVPPVININSGGGPGSGTGAAPLLPGPLKQADADKAGKLLVPAQRQALMQKKPICAICEKAKLEAQNA